jgi:SNF2 family DNA or RNA helicase
MLKEALTEYRPAYIVGGVKDIEAQKERIQHDPECRVMIGTIGALGTGHTLTAGSYVIFFDKAWTPADNEQAEDRCHRIGTTETVNVITLVAKDTIDEKLEEILKSKKDLFNQVVEGHFISVEDRRAIVEKLLGIS